MQLKQVYKGENSDNILTKSRKLEKKSSWIVKLRSSLTLEKPTNHARRFQFLFNIYLGYRSLCTCVCNYDLCSLLVSRGAGPLTVGGPGSLNLLNLPLLRHCIQPKESQCDVNSQHSIVSANLIPTDA